MQELDEIFRTGIPPSADQEAFERERIRALVAGIIDAQGVVRTRSAALYTEWCSLPNVTLDQAAWLLLECNPWKPISWTGLAGEELRIRHARVRNRLECEAGRWLGPLKPYVPGLPLRFYIADIARIAESIGLETAAARVLSEINANVANGAPASGATPNQRRMDERMRLHRLYAGQLAASTPPGARPIPPKAKPSTRRKYAGPPVNMEVVGMTQEGYCQGWRQIMQSLNPGAPLAQDGQLIEDCRGLNIAFAQHRPKGSKDKQRRRRTSR